MNRLSSINDIKDMHLGIGLYIYLFEGILIPIFSLIFNTPDVKISVEDKNNIIPIADELKKLNDLKDSGIISESEFKQQKDKLLNK